MPNVANTERSGLVPFRFGGPILGGKMQDTKTCGGKHYIYVAEVIYIQKDGKLHVVNVCRACGNVAFHEKEIASPGTPAILLQEKEKKNEL